MSSKAEWAFHITDPLSSGIALSPDQLPSAVFNFVGKTDIPAPPPTHVDVEILSFWSARNLDGTYGRPAYSNICQIVNLKIPSNLRGSQVYDATLELWPKQSLSSPMSQVAPTFATSTSLPARQPTLSGLGLSAAGVAKRAAERMGKRWGDMMNAAERTISS